MAVKVKQTCLPLPKDFPKRPQNISASALSALSQLRMPPQKPFSPLLLNGCNPLIVAGRSLQLHEAPKSKDPRPSICTDQRRSIGSLFSFKRRSQANTSCSQAKLGGSNVGSNVGLICSIFDVPVLVPLSSKKGCVCNSIGPSDFVPQLRWKEERRVWQPSTCSHFRHYFA
jgi:hypothetical protein